MIHSVRDFVRYFDGIRRRTWVTVDRVTPPVLAWAPRPGEYSCGDVIRHLAGAERFFIAKVLEGRWTEDLDPGPPLDYGATRKLLEDVHQTEMARLLTMPDDRLGVPIQDLDGGTLKAWRFLMAMVEHEVHHRSQLDCYLAEAGIEPPQLYGYRMEDVVGRARNREPRRNPGSGAVP